MGSKSSRKIAVILFFWKCLTIVLLPCSEWPTIPQLYVAGEFVGGCDIVLNSE